MDPVWKKLQFKDVPDLYVLNAPDSFQPALQTLPASIHQTIHKGSRISFFIGFAVLQKELNAMITQLQDKLEADAIVWFCYPKGSSKKYTCDFNRDTGWEKAGELGLEPVRQIAIDNDWSALRFRDVRFIKTLNRSHDMALSKEGKSRTAKHKG